MNPTRLLRGEIEEKYDHMELTPEEIDLVVEAFIYRASPDHNPYDVLEEAEILQKTLTRSTIYNYSNRHLKVVE